jgi:hypothetical protein
MSDIARSSAVDASLTVVVKLLDEERERAFPALLQVEIGRRRFIQRFDFGLNAEVLWSPDANRFAITGSAQGAERTSHDSGR